MSRSLLRVPVVFFAFFHEEGKRGKHGLPSSGNADKFSQLNGRCSCKFSLDGGGSSSLPTTRDRLLCTASHQGKAFEVEEERGHWFSSYLAVSLSFIEVDEPRWGTM